MAFPSKILVPLDFDPSSEAALERAIELARVTNAALHLLHVYPTETTEVPSRRIALPIETHEQAREKLDAVAERTKRIMSGHVSSELAEGASERLIVQRATEGDYDLIAMGTHSRLGRVRALAGSVAEGVIRGAPCPVLVVHEPE